jgi:hypothetical protein
MNTSQKMYVLVVLLVVVSVSFIAQIVFIVRNSGAAGERQRYAKLESEFACQLLKTGSAADVWTSIQDFGPLAQKYGFEVQDINNLRTKYSNDQNFIQLVTQEMKAMCPYEASNYLGI